MDDPYETLGIRKDARKDQIKRAWRRLSARWHPDRAKPEEREAAGEQQAKINRAYRLLTDDSARARYDAGEDIQQPVDNLIAEALALLAELFQAAIAQNNAPRNLIPELASAARRRASEEKAAIALTKRQIAEMERLLGMVKRKGQGANPFDSMLEATIEERRILLVRLQGQLETAEKAGELLETSFESGYVPPPPPPPEPQGDFPKLILPPTFVRGGDDFPYLRF